MKRFLIAWICIVLIFGCVGCAEDATEKKFSVKKETVTVAKGLDMDGALREAENSMPNLSEEDNVSENDIPSYRIQLKTDGSKVFDGENAAYYGTAAIASGNLIMIREGGTFLLSGELNGEIEVDTVDRVHLIFDGVDVTCENYPAVRLNGKGKKIITLKENSDNRLSDGTGRKDASLIGALHSSSPLTVNGKGALTVSSRYDCGILAESLTVVESTVTVAESVNSGIETNEFIYLSAAKTTVKGQGNGIKTKLLKTEAGKLSVEVRKQGIVCEKAGVGGTETQCVAGGNGWAASVLSAVGAKITVTAYDCIACGGETAEGIVRFSDCILTLNAADEAIAASKMRFVGGAMTAWGRSYPFAIAEGIESDIPPVTVMFDRKIAAGTEIGIGERTFIVQTDGYYWAYIENMPEWNAIYLNGLYYSDCE